jgi:hypothetical protein
VQNIVVVHAGRLLDRPGRSPRGPSTIVIRDGRISEVHGVLARARADLDDQAGRLTEPASQHLEDRSLVAFARLREWQRLHELR